MRIHTFAVCLLSMFGMVALCFWEASRVRRNVRTFDPDADSIVVIDSTGTPSVVGDAKRLADSHQPSEAANQERDPLNSSDAHLRKQINSIFTEASSRLPGILTETPEKRSPNFGPNSPRDVDVKVDRPRAAEHWAFRRLQRPESPVSEGNLLASNPIDFFVETRLAEKGLALNPQAESDALLRRLSFDLRGLPPLLDEAPAAPALRTISILAYDNQEAAEEADTYRRFVEHYLQEPTHGEHWARMWLDVARFADSDGYELDDLRPHAYPYRDFVIWALNEDLPFDRFIKWQIAGDELAPDLPPAVAATGFLAAAPHNTFMPQPSERYDELHDMISTMGSAMLGITIGCARCHDHRYDPISTVEYYRLVSVFESVERTHRYLLPDGKGDAYAQVVRPLVECEDELHELLVERIREDKIAKLDLTEEQKELLRRPIDPNSKQQRDLLALCGGCLRADGKDFVDGLKPLPRSAQRYAQLQQSAAQLKATIPFAPPQSLIVTGSNVVKTHVLAGGSLQRKGEVVGPGFLTSLTPSNVDWTKDAWKEWSVAADQSADARPRSALANWMTDVNRGAGPLLARVIVNRIWQHYFARGLVATPNDFGAQGDRPSHPELLEWLACELVDSGWSLKHIHRLIVCSKTYRQSSFSDAERLEIDPQNRLFSRYRRKRLTAEMFRDGVIAASGNLNREMYGPSIFPPIPGEAIYTDDFERDSKWPTDIEEGPDVWRRSIYVALRRSNTVPILDLLDACDGGLSQGKRNVTHTPVQSLALFNSPFVRIHAALVAEELSRYSNDLGEQVELLYQMVLQRQPTEAETDAIYVTIARRREESAEAYDVDVMTDVCHVLFMSNEFIYLD